MSIATGVYGLNICAVLDSRADKNVSPLQHYNAIHSEVQPILQHSTIKTVLGVRPGEVPVLGETHIEVQLNNRLVSIHFMILDSTGDEALLGQTFLTEA